MAVTADEERPAALAEASEALLPEGAPEEKTEGTAVFFSSYINLLNTVIGAGMLALPYAFAVCGYILGVIGLVTAACLSAYGLTLLGESARLSKSRNTTYGKIAEITYPKSLYIIDAAVAFKCFGVGTSYLIVIGDQMPKVAEYLQMSGMWLDREIWILLTLPVLLPLALYPKMDALKWTSLLAIVSAAYLLVIILTYAFVPSWEATIPCKRHPLPEGVPGCHDKPESWTGNDEILSVVPIFVFSFTCHQNIFTVHNEARDNSRRTTNRVIASVLTTAVTVYLALSLAGYMTFGPGVVADIIKQYPTKGNALVGICRLFITVLVLFSYPLQSHPSRAHAEHLIEAATQRPTPRPVHYGITCVIVAGGVALAISVDSLKLMLALVGATASTTLCYILPGIFYCKMTYNEPRHFDFYGGVCMFCLGCIIVPVSLLVICLYGA